MTDTKTTDTPAKKSPLVAIMHYFEMPIATFKVEWAAVDDAAKLQLRAGIENGTLTY